MFLYDFASKFRLRGKVLEVGGGCGVLSLLLKRDFEDLNVTVIEKQEEMYKFLVKNIKENSLDMQALRGDFLEWEFEGKFDFIITNPPFYNGSLKSENEILKVARYEEYLPMKAFFQKANSLLSERGEIIMCYDSKRIDDIILNLPKPLKMTDLRFMYPRITKNATLLLTRLKRHAKSAVTIHPPLIGFEGADYSDEASKIYKKAACKSVKI